MSNEYDEGYYRGVEVGLDTAELLSDGEHSAQMAKTIARLESENRSQRTVIATHFHQLREALGLPDDSTLSWEQLINAAKMQRIALRSLQKGEAA